MASQLQIHPFCLLCEKQTDTGLLNISPLTTGTTSSFISRGHRRDIARGKKFFLPASSVLAWQARAARTDSPALTSCLTGSFSSFRLPQCLWLLQFQLLRYTTAFLSTRPHPQLEQFCNRVPPVRHRPINRLPWHHKKEISSKFYEHHNDFFAIK